MKFNQSVLALLCLVQGAQESLAFAPSKFVSKSVSRQQSKLNVSIGLGPGEEAADVPVEKAQEPEEIKAPDYELTRDSRLSEFDRECDSWYGNILKADQPSFLGKVSEEALRRINTLPKLERPVSELHILLSIYIAEMNMLICTYLRQSFQLVIKNGLHM